MTTTAPARITAVRASRTQRRATAVTAVLLALLLVSLGVVLGRASQPAPPTPGHPAPPAGASANPGEDTRDGAVRAATTFLLALTSRAYAADPAVRVATIRAIATPGAVADLTSRAGVNATPTAPGDPLVAAFTAPASSAWRVVPIGYRVDVFSGHQATIAVWSVLITAATGPAIVSATATWTTTTLPLQWIDAGWRVDLTAIRAAIGPTPGPAGEASPDLDVISADHTFTGYDDTPLPGPSHVG